jgi:ubiquinone/menaquinone biosynthesis C-methylase UbiE
LIIRNLREAGMGFYRDYVLPRLCDCAMGNRRLRPYRNRVAGAAEGRVLEIGAGSGRNLAFYAKAGDVLALEPDPKLIEMARRAAKGAPRPVAFLEASAEQIPLADRCVDTVVSTFTLCTIPHAVEALREMRRVLKPGGRLLFVEHGLGPTPGVQMWQHWLTPVWSRIAGGCRLDRPIDALIREGGFRLTALQTGYAPGPKVMTWFYEGAARAR